jgi:hypothetical protein
MIFEFCLSVSFPSFYPISSDTMRLKLSALMALILFLITLTWIGSLIIHSASLPNHDDHTGHSVFPRAPSSSPPQAAPQQGAPQLQLKNDLESASSTELPKQIASLQAAEPRKTNENNKLTASTTGGDKPQNQAKSIPKSSAQAPSSVGVKGAMTTVTSEAGQQTKPSNSEGSDSKSAFDPKTTALIVLSCQRPEYLGELPHSRVHMRLILSHDAHAMSVHDVCFRSHDKET